MQRPFTLIYCLYFTITGFLIGSIGPSLPIFAELLSLELSAISRIFSAFFLGYLLGSLTGGVLVQQIPGHRVLIAGLFCIGLVSAITPWLIDLWLLVVTWSLLGVCSGISHAVLNTLLIWMHRDKVAPYMNIAHFSFGFGALVIPIVLAQSLHFSNTIASSYWFISLATIPLIVRLKYLPSPAISKPTTKTKEANKGRYPDTYIIAPVICILFLYVGVETSFAGWVPSYAAKMNIASVTTAAYFSSAFWAALTLGRLLWIPYTKRITPDKVLMMSFVACTVSTGFIYAVGDTFILLLLGITMMGLSMSSIFPSCFAFLERHIHMTGYISSLCLVGSGLGGMLFPWLIGQFF